MLAVILTIMGRSICSANIYCDNKEEGIYAVLAVTMTIKGRLICTVNSYCDNNDYNGEVYM